MAKSALVASLSLSLGIGKRQPPIRPEMQSSTSPAKPWAAPLVVRPVSLTVRLSVTLPRAAASLRRYSF